MFALFPYIPPDSAVATHINVCVWVLFVKQGCKQPVYGKSVIMNHQLSKWTEWNLQTE